MLEAPVGAQNTAVQTHNPRPGASSAVSASGLPAAGADSLAGPGADQAPVASIMTRKVISFTTETSLEAATATMLARGISGAPVVDASGRPVGMLSKTDLLEAWQEHLADGPGVSPPRLQRHNQPLPTVAAAEPSRLTVRVGDIMVPYLLAVASTAPLSLASALMAYEGVHRLLVLDDNNEMVGIITALDVLRWLAQLSGFCLPRHTQRQRSSEAAG